MKENDFEIYLRKNSEADAELAEFRGGFLNIAIDIESRLTEIISAWLVDQDMALADRLLAEVFGHRSITFFTKIDVADNLTKSLEDFPVAPRTLSLVRDTAERRNTLAHLNQTTDLWNLEAGPVIKTKTSKGRVSKEYPLDHEIKLRWNAEAKEALDALKRISRSLISERLKQLSEEIKRPIELNFDTVP